MLEILIFLGVRSEFVSGLSPQNRGGCFFIIGAVSVCAALWWRSALLVVKLPYARQRLFAGRSGRSLAFR